MRGLSMATPRSYRPQLPKDGTLLRALRPDDRAAVAPAGESTRPPHALAASRLRVGTHRTCIARAPRARPAPRRLRSPPLHRARHVCPSPHAVLGGGLCGTPQQPGDTHAGGAGLARADTAHSVRLCWPLAPSFPIMNVARRMHNCHHSSQCDARHASLRGTLSTLVRAVFLPPRWHSRSTCTESSTAAAFQCHPSLSPTVAPALQILQ